MRNHLPRILITTGPTREYFDPTRFLSNPSSGKMGWLLAQEAKAQGCPVKLIHGPLAFKVSDIPSISVTSALEMFKAVKKNFKDCDILIMSAAVCDYRPQNTNQQKIKKSASQNKILHLVPNPDILKWAGEHKENQLLVGFAAETENIIQNAQKKLIQKNLNIIIANEVGTDRAGFESEYIKFSLLEHNDTIIPIKRWRKSKLAQFLIQLILKKFHAH